MCPLCARFFNLLLWLNTRGAHEQASGCTFYEPVRPDGAQNKTLISNTVCYLTLSFHIFFTSFDAPVPISMHLGSSFDSPEAFFLVIYNIFINMIKYD